MNKQTKLLRLVESGLLLAVAAVLSFVKVLDLPYGGSVTACAALPILLVGYRHGTVWGLFVGFAYALIQLLTGMNTLSYFTSPLSVAAVILLDYLLAFTLLGLGGIFRNKVESQGKALVLGALLTGGLRYLCHVIAGCTVWAGLSIPDSAALVYSLAYNATYMIPDTAVAMLGAWYLSRGVDLRGVTPARAAAVQPLSRPLAVLSLLGKAALLVAAVWDVVLIFAPLQDPETGDFVIQNLSLVPWGTVGIITAAGIAVWGMLTTIAKKVKN
ncbi:MAG: energy-coupled thiamine transporter ThiT [Clostridia bacterium]|nr:energy-coupled thiamine transporter ThiT [Clostridia bacterium]